VATELKDKFGRKISYLRLSITCKCNLKCGYCYSGDSSFADSSMRADKIFKLVRALAGAGVYKVRITGGEPLLRNDITEIISRISEIKSIKDLSITTNGALLEKYAEKISNSGINRINVSLDSLKPETYNKITGGCLQDVLNGISCARNYFTDIRVNVVLLKDLNDEELTDFVEFGKQNNLTVRFLELMPVKAREFRSTPDSPARYVDYNRHFLSIESAKTKLEKKYLLTPLKSSEVVGTARWFNVDSGNTRIGFIAPLSAPFCEICNRIRIASDGKVFPCLHDSAYVSVKKMLSEDVEDDLLIEKINSILQKKQFKHKLNELEKSESDMMFLGG